MEYELPEKLLLFMDKAIAFEELRDKCIKSPFGFRRARRCAIDLEYFKRKFWGNVQKMYPELENKSLHYNSISQTVSIKAPNK